jgi:transcription termination factor Rho
LDEVIFEEFKGTGNMELRLDRRIAERRLGIRQSTSTPRPHAMRNCCSSAKQLNQVWKLRRVLNGLAHDGESGARAGLELLIDRLKTFNNTMSSWPR